MNIFQKMRDAVCESLGILGTISRDETRYIPQGEAKLRRIESLLRGSLSDEELLLPPRQRPVRPWVEGTAVVTITDRIPEPEVKPQSGRIGITMSGRHGKRIFGYVNVTPESIIKALDDHIDDITYTNVTPETTALAAAAYLLEKAYCSPKGKPDRNPDQAPDKCRNCRHQYDPHIIHKEDREERIKNGKDR